MYYPNIYTLYTGKLVCPNDPCSMTKCGFHATCNIDNAQAVCSCDLGYEGNPYSRCYPKPPQNCDCLTQEMTRFFHISYPNLQNIWKENPSVQALNSK